LKAGTLMYGTGAANRIGSLVSVIQPGIFPKRLHH
jgi:hypothetical protein